MNAVLVPLVARREEPTLEGAAARASGVDVEAPRLDCSADEWHDSERPRERRNQPSWVSGPRANASDAGLCNMAAFSCFVQLCERVWVEFRGRCGFDTKLFAGRT